MIPKFAVAAVFLVAAMPTSNARAGEKQKFTAPPPPSAGKALILVYRHHNRIGGTHATLFANDEFVADLRNGDYAPYEVQPGTVTFTEPAGITLDSATAIVHNLISFPPPDSLWASDPTCASVNWRRPPASRPDDVLHCKAYLNHWISGFDKICTSCNYSRVSMHDIWMAAEMKEALAVLQGTNISLTTIGDQPVSGEELTPAARKTIKHGPLLQIEVEAGKTYYIEWTYPHFSTARPETLIGTMKLMDASEAEKPISELHLAEYR